MKVTCLKKLTRFHKAPSQGYRRSKQPLRRKMEKPRCQPACKSHGEPQCHGFMSCHWCWWQLWWCSSHPAPISNHSKDLLVQQVELLYDNFFCWSLIPYWGCHCAMFLRKILTQQSNSLSLFIFSLFNTVPASCFFSSWHKTESSGEGNSREQMPL
jgi:hypothetical protein